MQDLCAALSATECSQLENGLSYALRSNMNSRLVTTCFAIGTGTSCETTKTNGLAHMATHLHILGTQKRTAKDISAEAELAGSEIQFFVHPEKTEYYLHLPPELVEAGIEIMSDCLMNSVFLEHVLKREQTVIEQEIVERRDNSFVFASDIINEVSFPNQGYGFCPLGTIESMYELTVQMLKDYSHQYFNPQNISIGAYGCIEFEKLQKHLESYFGRYKNPEGATVPNKIKPIFENNHRYVCKPQKNELAHAFMNFPLSDDPKEIMVSQIVAKILGCGTSSRFFQGLRQERALGYTMGSNVDSFGGLSFLKFYYSGWKKKEDYNLLGDAALLLSQFSQNVTDNEVHSGRNKVFYDLNMALDYPFSCAGMLAEQSLYGENPTEAATFIDPLNLVTLEEVKIYAEKILMRNPAVSFVGNYQPVSYNALLEMMHGDANRQKSAA
jgi:predicted Zn-dependent peptidase